MVNVFTIVPPTMSAEPKLVSSPTIGVVSPSKIVTLFPCTLISGAAGAHELECTLSQKCNL